MTDTDKILQKLEQLEAGQKALQADVTTVKSDVTTLKSDVTTVKTDVAVMKGEVAKVPGMQQQLSNLELNVEASRAEQRHANEELLTHIINGYDENAKKTAAVAKRVDRIEQHLNLPPVK